MTSTEKTNVPSQDVTPTPVAGYRELTEADKFDMNELKALEQKVLDKMQLMQGDERYNQRSLSIAITNVQSGFMWGVRAVARPNGE